MKVFISWSGKRSKALAIALKEWIPLIVQHAKPWVSDNDISAGDRWAQAIAGELESSNFGILCITPENLSSEWILFEAGALSKAMQDAKVIPFLLGLELSDLSGPLSQFQALKVDEPGMLNALKAMNQVSDTKTDEATIERLVPALWPQLREKLDQIPDKNGSGKHMRPQTEILEDLVSQVRGLSTRMREFDADIVEQEIVNHSIKHRDLDPRMLEEMMRSIEESHLPDFSLLILAGFVRDKMPWLAETFVEAQRELKTASVLEIRQIYNQVHQIVMLSTKSEWAKKMMRRNGRQTQRLMMEIPIYMDRAMALSIANRQFLESLEADEKIISK